MKLWEVLKELDENPKKVFESVNYSQAKIDLRSDGYCYRFPVKTLDMEREWNEVKQPVPWQEAIEAWSNGKVIRSVFNNSENIYKSRDFLVDYFGATIQSSELKNGTWYIED